MISIMVPLLPSKGTPVKNIFGLHNNISQAHKRSLLNIVAFQKKEIKKMTT